MIALLFDVVAPVFIIIFLGWGWARLKFNYHSPTITSVVMNVGAPSLVFSTLSSLIVEKALLGQMAIAAILTMLGTALLVFILLKIFRLSPQGLLPPLVFGNTGNMGMPICLFAFGNQGLTLAVIVFAVYSVSTMVLGTWIYSGVKNPLQLLKTPVVYAVILSVIVLLNGFHPPELILKTTRLLGQFTIPLMIFTLGVSLAQLDVSSLRRALSMSTIRLGLGFAMGLLIAHLMGLTGIARGVLVLQSSMPVAVFNYLLAERYQRNSREVAELVFVTTLLSLLTLPLILTFLS